MTLGKMHMLLTSDSEQDDTKTETCNTSKIHNRLRCLQGTLIAMALLIMICFISIVVMASSNSSQQALIDKLLDVETPEEISTIKRDMASELKEMKSLISNLTDEFQEIKETNTTTPEEISTIKRDMASELKEMKSLITNLTDEFQEIKETNTTVSTPRPTDHGVTDNDSIPANAKVTYEHWGLTTCPSTAELVYKGIMAGGVESFPGGGSNYLCLPDVPVYTHTVPRVESFRAPIGATEFRFGGSSIDSFSPMNHLHGGDPPCAVCLAARNTMIIMPGKNTCPPNWTLEYDGFMMAARSDRRRTEFVCVDVNSVIRNGTGQIETNYSQLLLAETRCQGGDIGGLPCPPYENGSELTCAVCTK